jgi:hypothetical protein
LRTAIRRADKAVKTYKVLNPAKDFRQSLKPSRALGQSVVKREIAPLRPEVLDRRTGEYKRIPCGKTGIKFRASGTLNDAKLLNEVYLCHLYVYQQCRDAYNTCEIRNATRCYHMVRKKRHQWRHILSTSSTAKQFWRVVSLTLRLAKSSAMRKGRPHCGTEHSMSDDRATPLGDAALSLRGLGARSTRV